MRNDHDVLWSLRISLCAAIFGAAAALGPHPLLAADADTRPFEDSKSQEVVVRPSATPSANDTLQVHESPRPPQAAQDESAQAPTPPSEGLWPSPKLTELLLSRWADEAAARYELDERQQEQFREALVDRWTGFLEENRPTLQPLANEFIEMKMGLEPPAAKQVQSWSGRAMPAFDTVREKLRESQDDFRAVLRPKQRAKFELDAMKTAAGLELAEYKLQRWSQGHVEPEDLWEPLPSMRKERRGGRDRDRDQAERETAEANDGDAAGQSSSENGAAVRADDDDEDGGADSASSRRAASKKAAQPKDQIAAELTAWEKYVAEFIVRHELAEGQRTAVLSCLSELTERARLHGELHREEIAKLETRIAGPKNEADVAEIREKLVELYGPVDGMFAELKDRLEAILTTEQKARAAETEAPPPTSGAAGAPPANSASAKPPQDKP